MINSSCVADYIDMMYVIIRHALCCVQTHWLMPKNKKENVSHIQEKTDYETTEQTVFQRGK